VPTRRVCPEGDGYKWCPDCRRCVPLAEFNRGQDYCKPHQLVRVSAARAKALATSEEARAKKRAADARYRERHKGQHAAYMRTWKRRNADKVAAWYARWAEQNPDKRRATQEAWRERRKLRAAAYRFKTDYAPRPEYDPGDE
jgi:hypothetical protein